MPDYLAEFYTELRSYIRNNKYSKELADSFLNAGQKQACRIISKYKPLVNQKKDISVTANSTSVELPSNFRSAKLGALYKLKYGSLLNYSAIANQEIDIYSQTQYGKRSRTRFDSDGRSYAQVPDFTSIGGWAGLLTQSSAISNSDSFNLEIFANGKKGFSLWFDEEQTVVARVEKLFPYTGLHQITSEVDTITEDIRDVFLDLCAKHAFLEAERQFAQEGKTSEAKVFGEQAIEYGESLFDIRATVAVTEF